MLSDMSGSEQGKNPILLVRQGAKRQSMLRTLGAKTKIPASTPSAAGCSLDAEAGIDKLFQYVSFF